MTDLTPEFLKARERMIAESGPIIGHQRAALGADRFTRFTEGHATVQAMALFLVMSALTVAQVDYSDGSLQALRTDAADLRRAADQWATDCEELADMLQAQRQEHEPRESEEEFERRADRLNELHKGELE